MVAFLESGAAVDRHLADQLLLPLALADGDSTFTASEVTRHMQRQADVIAQFLGVEIRFVGEAPVKVEIRR
jgi:RNA 3'-terminal phosphate cyclase (ATP)